MLPAASFTTALTELTGLTPDAEMASLKNQLIKYDRLIIEFGGLL